jgi:hypothetical protein
MVETRVSRKRMHFERIEIKKERKRLARACLAQRGKEKEA